MTTESQQLHRAAALLVRRGGLATGDRLSAEQRRENARKAIATRCARQGGSKQDRAAEQETEKC